MKKNSRNGATAPAFAPVAVAPPTVSGARIEFERKDNGPERLVAEASIVFDTDPAVGSILAGMKLVGFALWSSPDGEVYVTFPSRAFGAGGGRRYFDYLRSTDGQAGPVKAIKAWILDEYKVQSSRSPALAAAADALHSKN